MTARDEDRGSAAVELVLLAPVLVVLLLFVVLAGRSAQAVQQVRHAADQGARAASIVSRPAMPGVARRAVLEDLDANGVACQGPLVSVAVTTTDVTVTVRCRVGTAGLSMLGVRPRTVQASSTEVIDRYRGGS